MILTSSNNETNAIGCGLTTKKRTVPPAGGCSNHKETIVKIATPRANETANSNDKIEG